MEERISERLERVKVSSGPFSERMSYVMDEGYMTRVLLPFCDIKVE